VLANAVGPNVGAAAPVGARSAQAGAQQANAAAGTALVPSPRKPGEAESEPGFGPLVERLPVEMDVAVPVREFRVRNLLALEPGTLIESRWNHGNDLPLAAGDVTLAWTEFEVIETSLAVRVTRLA
jgi:flagellar motor switch protein FliN/FliY